MNTRKRANSECNENKKKKIKLEEGVHSINTTCYATSSKTIKPGKKKKSQSEPPSFKKKCVTPEIKKYASGNIPTSTVSGSSLKDKNFRNRRTSSSASTASRSYSSSTPFSSSIYPSVVGVDRQRTNSVGRSLQKFNPFRGASAPVLSSASLQGSTPTVRYIGPPNQVVRSGIQQMPVPPSASGSGTNGRNRSSATASGDQAGPSILMRIEWASIDNPFLCGGHPILLQGKGTIPEMMNNIKSQVTRFENSLKKKLAKGA